MSDNFHFLVQTACSAIAIACLVSLNHRLARLRALLRRVLFKVQMPIALREEIEKEVGDAR